MKIGIIGDNNFYNKFKIRDIIWALKNKFSDISIVTCGMENSTDIFIKKYCIEFNVKYEDSTPYHKKWNSFTIEPRYLYEKSYSPKWYFTNNKNFVDYCDSFIFLGNISNNKGFKNIIENIEKQQKIYKNIK